MYRQAQLQQLVCQCLAALPCIPIDKYFIHHIDAGIFQKTVCRSHHRDAADFIANPVHVHDYDARHFKFLVPVMLEIRHTFFRVPVFCHYQQLGKFLSPYHALADINFP